MGKFKEKLLSKATEADSSWVEENDYALAHAEGIRANAKIILRIKQYMEDRRMTQKELAAKLSVTPQYIHKLLHGVDADLKISTAVRYGTILGMNLIEIPEPDIEAKRELIVKIGPIMLSRLNCRKEVPGKPNENNAPVYYNTLKTEATQTLNWNNGKDNKYGKRLS